MTRIRWVCMSCDRPFPGTPRLSTLNETYRRDDCEFKDCPSRRKSRSKNKDRAVFRKEEYGG